MARKFKLNTGAIATLSQLVVGTPSGKVYDHLKREAAGVVTMEENEERDAVEMRKNEKGGVKTLTET